MSLGESGTLVLPLAQLKLGRTRSGWEGKETKEEKPGRAAPQADLAREV